METVGGDTAEVSLDVDLVQAAKAHGVDVRAAAEAGVRTRIEQQVDREKDAKDIRVALEQYEAYADEHGSFAEEWRSFRSASSTLSGTVAGV